MKFVSWATFVVVFGLALRVSAERPPQRAPVKPQVERKTIESDAFVFGNPAVGSRLHHFEAAARELAQENWGHQPFHARSPETIFWRTWWGKPAGSIDRFGYFDRQKKQKPGEERQIIRIDALRNREQPHSVVAVCLLAAWSPPGNGWTANVSYCFPRRHPTSGDAFDLGFKYRDKNIPERDQITIRLSDHLSKFTTRKTYDDTTYGIQVTLDAAELFTNRISSDEVRHWYASPESLRGAALGRLDRLEKLIEADVRSGSAVRFAHGGDGPRPPQGAALPALKPFGAVTQLVSFVPPPPNSDRPLTDNEQQEIIKEGRAQVEMNRKRVKDHFKQFHAVLLKTFPLADCLP